MNPLGEKEKEYLASGRALVNGQIPTQTIENTPAINSKTLNNTQETPFKTAETTPFYDVSKLEIPLTQPEKQAQSLTEQALDLNRFLTGESTYRAQQEEQSGLGQLQKTQNDLVAKLKSLQFESQNLQNIASSIPDVMQEQSAGRGITAGGLAPLTAGELRKNSIQQRAIASQALTTAATLQAVQGNIDTANTLIDRAVAQKYGQAKAEREAIMQNLGLILQSPAYTQADKARAQRQLEIQQQKEKDEGIKEARDKAVLGIAMQVAATGKATTTDLQKIQNAGSEIEAAQLASPFLQQNKFVTQQVGADFIQYELDPQGRVVNQKVLTTDEMARQKAQLEMEATRTNIERARADIAKTKAETQNAINALPPQTQIRVQTIANQFDNEQAVKSYQVSAEAIDAVRSAGTTSTDDQSRIYAFAKVMDPNSVVRESEYKTVQDYSMALFEKIGFTAKRVFDNTGFLTNEARQFMLTTLENRLKSSQKAYNNIYSEYGRRINKITGKNDGTDYLTDYSRAFTQPETTKTTGTIVIAPDGTQIEITD